MKTYGIRFKNTAGKISNTAFAHYSLLEKKGKVLWGAWNSNVTDRMPDSTYARIKTELPIRVIAFDSSHSCIEMIVDDIHITESVENSDLKEFVPNYYKDRIYGCAIFYSVTKIEVHPVEYAREWQSLNGMHTNFSEARQIPSKQPRALCRVVEEVKSEEVEVPVIETQLTFDLAPTTKEDTSHTVYCYTNRVNGKKYIGITNDLDRRHSEHFSEKTWRGKDKKKYFYIALQEHGTDKFNRTIIAKDVSLEEARLREAFECKVQNTYWPNGYNERDESYRLKALLDN